MITGFQGKKSQNFFEYEIQINDFIQYHAKNYRYVGPLGYQYSVVQSVLHEINQSKELINQHIRWYTIILSLIQSYRRYRSQISENNIILPEFFSEGLDAGSGSGNDDLHANPVIVDSIGAYITAVARLGLLVSARKKINPEYVGYKLEFSGSLLAKTLTDMDCLNQVTLTPEVFILTIKRATENAAKIEAYFPDKKSVLHKTLQSELYKDKVLQVIKKLPSSRIKDLFNMDDFWNGFIP